MGALEDVLARLTNPESGYGNEVTRYNGFEMAPALAQKIVGHQKQQRAAPFVEALQGYGQQYKGATTDEERTKANIAANLARADFVNSGGSPMDISKDLWGADPSQGFQFGKEMFAAPYAGDNLSIGQKERRAGITGMYEGQPTWPRTVQESSLTGMLNGQPTWGRALQEKAESRNDELFPLQKAIMQKQLANADSGGGGSQPSQSLIKNVAQAAIVKSVNAQFGEWWAKESSKPENNDKNVWEKQIAAIEQSQIDRIGDLASYGISLDEIYEATDDLRERMGLPPKRKGKMIDDGSSGDLSSLLGDRSVNP